MRVLPELIENNRKWACRVTEDDPDFFAELVEKQKPEFLWIGRSDSRVPANEIVGLASGEVFVHRNIANVVVHSDSTSQMAARSVHPGGVHVMMVDSSVRFVGNDVDSKESKNGCGPPPHGVWQAMHTRAGGEVGNRF